MNKKAILFCSFAFVAVITSCGPAAEEKAKMMQSSKRTADSIANVINTSMSSATEAVVAPPANHTAAPSPTVEKKP